MANEREPGAQVPTLFDWAGGGPVLQRMIEVFYGKVRIDPILESVFAEMPAEHPVHVTDFIAEVLGGPTTYSETRGGHAKMVRRHLGRNLTEQQRRRWVELLMDAADETGLPSDPEFRSAFVGYIEWGSRLAVINSQPGGQAPPDDAPMPKWGWGVPGGPYPGSANETEIS